MFKKKTHSLTLVISLKRRHAHPALMLGQEGNYQMSITPSIAQVSLYPFIVLKIKSAVNPTC